MLVVVTYHRVLSAGFVNWDDNRFLVENPLFHAGGWTYIEAALTRFQFEAYQPLHLLSYLPDRYLWPERAAGFHAVELGLWILDVGLVYALLRRHVWAPAALAACALFALHPLCVEPVAGVPNAQGRGEVRGVGRGEDVRARRGLRRLQVPHSRLRSSRW